MSRRLNRREALNVGVGVFAAGLVSSPGPARALNVYADQIKKFTGGKTPVEGRVKLELPELAENGNTVPLSVAVLPGEGAYVQEVLVVARATPSARVIRFRFSALSVPEASTRSRLAATQDVVAV